MKMNFILPSSSINRGNLLTDSVSSNPRNRTFKSLVKFFTIGFILILTLIGGNAWGQTTLTFTSNNSFTVPCGVTSVTVQIWGGGGGGGGDATTNGYPAGAGGGSGAFVTYLNYPVTAGQIYNFTVGSGGSGIVGTTAPVAGNSGGTSTFTGPGIALTASGGGPGSSNGSSGGAGGTGGSTATGGTTNTGGNTGGNQTAGSTSSGFGAGSPSGGGNVAGCNTNGCTGAIGSNYGGGGAGGGPRGGGSNSTGGAGAGGAVIITYTSSITAPTAGADQNACGTLTSGGNTPDAGWTGTWSVVSGTATITSPNSPTSTITGIPAGTCAVLRWTFTMAGCATMTDDVSLCAPNVCNDDPCSATNLPVSSGTCSLSTFSTVGATMSTGMPEPGCAVVNGPDVWYSVTVPASGQVQINSTTAGTFDELISIYDGACTDLAFSGCVSGVGSNVYPLTYAGPAGSTIYVRVNEGTTGDATTGSFELCAYEATTAAVSEVLPGVTTTVACGSTLNFYDPGGLGGTTSTNTSQPPPAGNYTNNTGTTWTICPDDPLQYVTISFTQFTMETGFDKLIILSGTNDVIAQWTGNDGQGDVISAQNPGECLTVIMQSDYIWTAEGWEAVVSCQATPAASQVNNEDEVMNCTGGGGVWVCSDGVYNTAAGAGAGIDEINEVTGGCWGASGEVATSWFYFTVAADGTLAFEFIPSNSGHNLNFALYGPGAGGVPPCPLLTGEAPIRCSFADIGGANTGLQTGQTDMYDILTGNGFSSPVNALAGETYALAVDVYQNGQPPTQTQIDFTGVAALDCTPVALPIVLGDFSGINQDRTNLLSWIVYSQMGNDYFTVERSMDGKHWEKVGDVDGAGTTQMTMYYSLVDENPYFPISYYRLIQTDVDGDKSYSSTISVANFKADENTFIGNIFPNPTGDFTMFTFQGTDTETPLNVTIINQMGEIVQNNNHVNLHKGMGSMINTSDMSAGLYQVIFTQGTNRQTQKLAIIR